MKQSGRQRAREAGRRGWAATLITAVLAALAAASLAPGAALAQATVEFVNPITLTNTQGLSFGAVFAPSSGPGTVTVTSTNTRSGTNVVFLDTGDFTKAEFGVTGDANATFAITLPTSATLTGPGANMTVDTFESTPAENTSVTLIPVFGGVGAAGFSVGATLTVGLNQVSGAYSGTFSVTVTYQ